MAKAVAQRGDSDFLVETEGGTILVSEDQCSRVENIDSMLSRGYWEEVTDKESAKKAESLAKRFRVGKMNLIQVMNG